MSEEKIILTLVERNRILEFFGSLRGEKILTLIEAKSN